MKLSLGEVAKILGTICEEPERIAQGYSIDTRSLVGCDLFFAIRGPRFDGHEFVALALESGASGAVVEQAFVSASHNELRRHLLAVASPTEALQRLARAVRQRWGKLLIAITGSTGKSTTKEMIAAIFAEQRSVLKSKGNLNNQFGLPLTLLALEPKHDVAVVELGMSAAGEIAFLARIAEPQMGVVTNVAPVHLEFFDSVDAIARAKRELVQALPREGTAVLNADDERVSRFADGFDGRVVSFGFSSEATFRISVCRYGAGGGSTFRLRGPSFEEEFRLSLPGRHNVQNAAAAIASAIVAGAAIDDCRRALEKFSPLSQRSEILTLPGGIVIINDTYNSNPLAMERMLETLAQWSSARRRIVVAGEMLELGPSSAELHRAIGRTSAWSGVDWLIGVQGDAKCFVEGGRAAGMPEERLRFFSSAAEAAQFCRTLLREGDVVLIKGSRGVHLERVVESLRSALNGETSAHNAAPQT